MKVASPTDYGVDATRRPVDLVGDPPKLNRMPICGTALTNSRLRCRMPVPLSGPGWLPVRCHCSPLLDLVRMQRTAGTLDIRNPGCILSPDTMDAIFVAVADPTRRLLLERLRGGAGLVHRRARSRRADEPTGRDEAPRRAPARRPRPGAPERPRAAYDLDARPLEAVDDWLAPTPRLGTPGSRPSAPTWGGRRMTVTTATPRHRAEPGPPRRPRTRVARLTDAGGAGQWFGQRADFRAEVGYDGWMEWDGHGRYAMRVEEAVPPGPPRPPLDERAGVALDPARSTLVEWDLEPTRTVALAHLRESGSASPEARAGNTVGLGPSQRAPRIPRERALGGRHPADVQLAARAHDRVWRSLRTGEFNAWWGSGTGRAARGRPRLVGLAHRGPVRLPDRVRRAADLPRLDLDGPDTALDDAAEVLRTEWALEDARTAGRTSTCSRPASPVPSNHRPNSGGWDSDVSPALRRALGEAPRAGLRAPHHPGPGLDGDAWSRPVRRAPRRAERGRAQEQAGRHVDDAHAGERAHEEGGRDPAGVRDRVPAGHRRGARRARRARDDRTDVNDGGARDPAAGDAATRGRHIRRDR